MSILGWRKRQIADQVDNDINEAPVVQNKDALYTVGLNEAGNTQLVLTMEYGRATLTIDPASVRRLIRQLEATLDEDESDDQS